MALSNAKWPQREPGAVLASALLSVELLPGTHFWTVVDGVDAPILAVDTGPIEVRFSVPGIRITIQDLRICASLIDAAVAYHSALVSYLD